MKRILIVGICLTLVLLVTSANASPDKSEFEPGALLDKVGKEIDLPKVDLDKVGKVLEEKGAGFKKIIDEEVDKGILQVNEIGKDFNKVVGQVEQGLDKVLADDKVKEIVSLLEKLENDMEGTIRQEIVAQLEKSLGMSKEQVEKAGAILEEEIGKRGQLVDKYINDSATTLAQFDKENDKMRDEMNTKLASVLKPEQMQEFKKWQKDIAQKMENLFSLSK